MKKKSFRGVIGDAAKSVTSDSLKQDHVESSVCGDHGCRLKADLFTGGPGSCLYHHLGKGANKNPHNITERINRNMDRLRTISIIERAPLRIINGTVRGTQEVPGEEPNTKENIQIIYPDWMPIHEGESHHHWIDRARSLLVEEIVSNAEKSRFS